MAIQGKVEAIERLPGIGWVARGWAVDAEAPDEPVRLALASEGGRAGRVPGRSVPPQTGGCGGSSGRNGFAVKLPGELLDGRPHLIRILVRIDGSPPRPRWGRDFFRTMCTANSTAPSMEPCAAGRSTCMPPTASPFSTSKFQTDGTIVTPCCNLPPIGTLGTQSLNDILNGQAVRRLRADLLTGKTDQHCRRCHIRAPAQPVELRRSVFGLLNHAG